MPTSYTAIIVENPGVSFAEFAWRCMLGVCVMQRDDSLNVAIPMEEHPSDFYQKSLDEARDERDRISALTEDQWAVENAASCEVGKQSFHESRARTIKENCAFAAMLAQVDAWEAPEEVVGLKLFMRQQLEISISDVHPEDGFARRCYRFEPMSQATAVAALNVRIARYEVWLAEELERVAARNHFKQTVRQSIGPQPENSLKHG